MAMSAPMQESARSLSSRSDSLQSVVQSEQDFQSLMAEDDKKSDKKKNTTLACVRCRRRHIKCPGGDPCKKCMKANHPCEYIEADRKIVMSMKYLNKLHDDISRLKIQNATLRNELKNSHSGSTQTHDNTPAQDQKVSQNLDFLSATDFNMDQGKSSTSAPASPGLNAESQSTNTQHDTNFDISIPFLDKYGKLINSRTGEKIYVGSSSMTLFGLEINNKIPRSNGSSPAEKDEVTVLEREGNAYRIKLGQTKLSPGIAVNFTLPSYSYASLLIDTFISYNDGCFYFFNEGLVKENLKRIYKGEKVFVTGDSSVTVETIWFCQLLLIFATGEMYLGTANKPNGNKNKKKSKPRLPGSEFFYQASELFTGLFSSGAITNCVLEGGIEVILLYAFYLQVADCTIASYFYFGSAVRACLMLGLHVDAGKENLARFELEHRRRLFWTVFMFERMLASKAGLPISLPDDYVSADLPDDFDMSEPPSGCEYYIFPEAEYIKNCVKITTINASILGELYSKQPNSNILPVVNNLVLKLLDWKNNLPDFLQCDFSKPDLEVSRLRVNMMTEYFQGMNLAVRPLLMHFTMQLKSSSTYVDLSSYSKQVLTLINSSFQASINTIRCLWALMPINMVALFGYMDREYLFTSAATLVYFNRAFGVLEATYPHLDHALTMFTKMRNLGNNPAALRRAQLLKLLSLLDNNGAMNALIQKYDDDFNVPVPDTDNMVSGAREKDSATDDAMQGSSEEQVPPAAAAAPAAPPPLALSSVPPPPNHHLHMMNADIRNLVAGDTEPDFGSPSLTAQEIPLTPEVFNQFLSTSSNEMEVELWNDITSQAMWLSGDVGDELTNLLGHQYRQ